MTVLEEERKMTSGLSLGDRYITPEYLAPLPTSVCYFFGTVTKRSIAQPLHYKT